MSAVTYYCNFEIPGRGGILHFSTDRKFFIFQQTENSASKRYLYDSLNVTAWYESVKFWIP